MHDLNKTVLDAVRDGVALQIAEALSQTDKDSLVAKAIADMMGHSVVREMIQKKLLARVEQKAAEVIADGRFDQVIVAAVAEGFADSIARVKKAAEIALPLALCGPADVARSTLLADAYARLVKTGQ